MGSRLKGSRERSPRSLKGLENAEKVSLEAKLLKPEDALKSYDGLYTDEYVK